MKAFIIIPSIITFFFLRDIPFFNFYITNMIDFWLTNSPQTAETLFDFTFCMTYFFLFFSIRGIPIYNPFEGFNPLRPYPNRFPNPAGHTALAISCGALSNPFPNPAGRF